MKPLEASPALMTSQDTHVVEYCKLAMDSPLSKKEIRRIAKTMLEMPQEGI